MHSFGSFLFKFSTYLLQVASIKEHHDQVLSDLNAARSKLKECDSQISCILKEQQKLQSKISEASLERKKMENEVLFFFLPIFAVMKMF